MKHSFPLSRKLFLSHFLVSVIVSSFLSVFLYLTARDSMIEQLRYRLSSSAALISRDIDANDMRGIRDVGDRSKPEYQETLATLRNMRRANQDIAFLYIMRREGDSVYFVVDSDETDEQAMPGDQYIETSPRLLEGFERAASDEEPYTDPWGTFISGYSPIVNSHGEFLVGIDMRADEMRNKLSAIHHYGLYSIIGAFVFSWIIGLAVSRHFRHPIEEMVKQVRAIGEGDYDRRLEIQRLDEMDTLVGAINNMAADLKKARQENIQLAESINNVLDNATEE